MLDLSQERTEANPCFHDASHCSSININVVHLPLCMWITKTQRLPVLLAEYAI